MIPALEEFLMGTKLFAKEKKKKRQWLQRRVKYFTGQGEDINKVKPLFWPYIRIQVLVEAT